ncbi:MAG: ABC transporter permease [Bacillota bacterium]|nr:ABC transporter permease [Bacillota bacterium]
MGRNRFLVSILAVVLGFVTGALVMLVTGHNPVDAYRELLRGAGLLVTVSDNTDWKEIVFNKRFGDTLLNMTTLILTGLSVAFAFRTGLFNIGAAGQMLMGGFFGSIVGVKLSFPAYIHVPLAVAASILGGALWAFIPGLFKARYRIHEVVTTIMMNYIALWTVYYFVPIYMKGSFETESQVIRSTSSLRLSSLTGFFHGSNVNIGLFLALAAVILIWWLLEKTTFGYELKAVGFNIHASRYAGMKVSRNMILSMMIAGALAGLAGATFFLGYSENMKIGSLPSQGIDGIAVALLGLNTPVGVLLSAFLFGIMNAGSLFMTSATDVPNELVSIIVAIIIYFAATSLMLETWLNRINKIFKRKERGKDVLE